MDANKLTEMDALLPPSPSISAPPPPYSRHSSHDDDLSPESLDSAAPIALEWRGTLGDVTLETTDGAKFLVHQEVLENECAFFYIYFKTHRPAAPVSASSSAGPGSLFCLDRWFQARPASVNLDSPPVPPKTGSVRSPQPLDRSAREWRIPETKAVFLAFLSFIYPLDAYPAEEQVTNMGLLRDVLRSGLGYQSERVVGRVKRALVDLAPTRPIGVYALASRYSLHDLAVIASRYALRVPDNEWPEGLKALMGAKGYQAIEGARQERIAAMQEILAGGMTLPQPECPCDHFAALQEIWKPHIQVCKQDVGATSTLHRVIAFDWSAAGCSSCQAIVQEAVSEILQRQREIKETI